MEKTIGSRIRERRRELGVTAGRLAALSDVTENAIRKIEAGDSAEPRFSTGIKIAHALSLSPLELATGVTTATRAPELAGCIRAIRAIRAELEKEGVEHVDVFGSVARGNATPESDVDVLVTPQPDARFSLFGLAAVLNHLRSALGRDVDVITPASIEEGAFALDIAAEAVRVF